MLYLRGLLMLTALMMSGHPVFASTEQSGPCPQLDASDPLQREALLEYVCFLEAAPGHPAHTISEPSGLSGLTGWTSAQGNDLVFSQTDSVYWARINVANLSGTRELWYLKLSYPLLDQVSFWTSDSDTREHIATGDQHPFLSRGIDYRYFLFPVTLDTDEKTTLTLRIQSDGALNCSISVPARSITFITPSTCRHWAYSFLPWADSPTSISGPTAPVLRTPPFLC